MRKLHHIPPDIRLFRYKIVFFSLGFHVQHSKNKRYRFLLLKI